jgi:hypothetical protein
VINAAAFTNCEIPPGCIAEKIVDAVETIFSAVDKIFCTVIKTLVVVEIILSAGPEAVTAGAKVSAVARKPPLTPDQLAYRPFLTRATAEF